MKKIAMLLIFALCLSLCGCPALQPATPPATTDVHITAGNIEPGMTVKDVFVEVTVNHQPVACRLELTALTNDGYYIMAEDEPVQEGFLARLDIYYSLPKGVDVDTINPVVDCEYGLYDGTGSVGDDANGCVEAWSHILYGKAQGADMIHTVHIRVGAVSPGMVVADLDAEVTIDEQPVEARITMTEHSDDGMREMKNTEIIPENTIVRLNVYYYLDQGITLDNIDVYMDCPDGQYDGTGSVGNHADGRIEAWSHAFYGLPEEPEQTQPTDSTEIVTYPTTHIHDWTEHRPSSVSCTTDTVITYSCTCGEGRQEIIPAPGHDMVSGALTLPTCTDVGTQTMRCTRCAYVLVIETPATGHIWTDWVKDTGRVHKHTCTVCGAEETENHKIPAGDVVCTECGEAIIN